MQRVHINRQVFALLLALVMVLASPLSVFANIIIPEFDNADESWDEAEVEDDEEASEDIDIRRVDPRKTAGDSSTVSVTTANTTTNSRRVLINNTSLRPTNPKSPELNELLDEILAEIITDDMDTYEQVKACYDYLVANTYYGSYLSRMNTVVKNGVTCQDIYSRYGEVEGYGAVVLTAHIGQCNAYNAAFILMVRKLGLSANLVKGSTRRAGGGYTAHQWTEVKINGTTYVFDPQLEQDLTRAGLSRYTVFAVTYDQVPGRYYKY